MQKVCTILARGGSKGVPGKNIRILDGKPLIVHTIQQALSSSLFDAIAVSSDCPEILSVSRQAGIELLVHRPDELASDQAAKLPAIIHCVSEVEKILNRSFDIVVDLDPTSPLRQVSDIQACCDLLVACPDTTNVITACPSHKSPYFNMVEVDDSGVARICKALPQKVVRRQDAPAVYDMNASIYAWWKQTLMEEGTIWQDGTRLYVMPAERSVDIDSELDFRMVELLMSQRRSV